MATVPFITQDQYDQVTEYLAQFDIDAGRIPLDAWDEQGYTYWDPSGYLSEEAPGDRVFERHTWPNKEVYWKVVDILYGTPRGGDLSSRTTGLWPSEASK